MDNVTYDKYDDLEDRAKTLQSDYTKLYVENVLIDNLNDIYNDFINNGKTFIKKYSINDFENVAYNFSNAYTKNPSALNKTFKSIKNRSIDDESKFEKFLQKYK